MQKVAFMAAIAAFILAPALGFAHDEDKTAKSTITGCLTGPTEDGTFLLKRVKAGDVQVGGLDDLKDHVGQEVKLKGQWAKNGAAIGEKENTAAKVGDKVGVRRHFRVSDVDKIADTCEQLHH
jgi:hypothetical protein